MTGSPAGLPFAATASGQALQTDSDDTAFDFPGVTAAWRCAYYREICQLPAVLDPVSGQIIVVAASVQAVMMGAALGQRIRGELERGNEGCGPIVAHPRSGSWTFITQSSRKLDTAASSGFLWIHNVGVMTSGARIGLPTPAARTVSPLREWVLPPYSPLRPTTATVLEIVLILLERGDLDIVRGFTAVSGRHRMRD